ncbi:MAG: phosphatase PAP2 family protein [Candidatus Omnitrophota bacterium]|nr:phosphatase PAP2 family protein [Candidatus Omnitrophota bacterium]
MNSRLGFFSLAYVFLAICLPRLYIGYHYPTDILAGALIGAAIAFLVLSQSKITAFVEDKILVWQSRAPAAFYAIGFLLSYQIANLFWECREFAKLGILILQLQLDKVI